MILPTWFRPRFWPGLMLVLACSVTARAQGEKAAAPESKPAATTWSEPEYLRWLEERSMLQQAREAAGSVSGQGVQWRHEYAAPQPRQAVAAASVWVLGYPGSVITRPGESVLATWADERLWETFRELGIELLHTGPVKRAGGIEGREHTPTVDGWFDRISLEIDPQLGTEAEYRRLVETAAAHGGSVAGDLVPLHTGKGADFRLAERNYKDYPGLYTMVEIDREDWGLLPEVASLWASAPVPKAAAADLKERGYIPGLIDSADASPEARELSGWDVTAAVVGADGKTRRWVYLNYFKPGQPTLNWLDPSLAGPRIQAGDLTRTIPGLGARVVRLDAVPFLGIEPLPGQDRAWGTMHPLSVQGTDQLAFLARKLGGFSFQELNVPLEQLMPFTAHGPDLSYDFFTRTECVHALLTGDAAPLRLAFGFLLDSSIQPSGLVHDLQNHDEITYQLVQLDHRGDERFTIRGREILGRQLREQILRAMRARAVGPAAAYNMLYRPSQDGVATTFAGFAAAALGVRDPYHATPEQVEQIQRAHLLLAWANAMQPGVFSLSSWDLVGALPLPGAEVADRMQDGDYRWINRGGVDLLGENPESDRSAFGLPRARALYGPLPAQLADPDSFASRLKRMLAARRKLRIAEGELLAVPEVENASLCLLAIRLPGRPRLALTALNFGRTSLETTVDLSKIEGIDPTRIANRDLLDAESGDPAGRVGADSRLRVTLGHLEAQTLVLDDASD